MKTYKIRSFQELGKILTKDNMKDITLCLAGVIGAFVQIKEKYPDFKLTGFNWRDDKRNTMDGFDIETHESHLIKVNKSKK